MNMEGSKYLTTHSTHFNYNYVDIIIVKDHSDNESEILLLPI